MSRIGIALAGGGPLGGIYEVGASTALEEAIDGLDLTQAHCYVGVSSGSFIAAALANGISPEKLANILLDDLDKELTKRGHSFVRYADDCNILVKSKRAGLRVLESVTQFVEGKLKLKVNRDKSAVDRPWNRKFLGFSFLVNKEATIRLAPKTLERIKDKVREITSRTRSVAMEQRIAELNRYLGLANYMNKAR